MKPRPAVAGRVAEETIRARILAQTAPSARAAPIHDLREWPRYSAERTFALSSRLDGRVYPCTVADVSLGGARLIFEDALPASIPNESQIELNHPEAERVFCQPVWRGSQEMGIQFDFSEESLGLVSICIRNMIDLDQQSVT